MQAKKQEAPKALYLHAHQSRAINFAFQKPQRHGLVFYFQMGMGKTLTTLSFLQNLKDMRVIVFSPNLHQTWVIDMGKPMLEVPGVLETKNKAVGTLDWQERAYAKDKKNNEYLFYNYEDMDTFYEQYVKQETEKKHGGDYSKFFQQQTKNCLFVFDEAHHLRRHLENNFKTSLFFDIFTTSRFNLMLTGTVVYEDISDLLYVVNVAAGYIPQLAANNTNGGYVLPLTANAFHREFYYTPWYSAISQGWLLPFAMLNIAGSAITVKLADFLDFSATMDVQKTYGRKKKEFIAKLMPYMLLDAKMAGKSVLDWGKPGGPKTVWQLVATMVFFMAYSPFMHLMPVVTFVLMTKNWSSIEKIRYDDLFNIIEPFLMSARVPYTTQKLKSVQEYVNDVRFAPKGDRMKQFTRTGLAQALDVGGKRLAQTAQDVVNPKTKEQKSQAKRLMNNFLNIRRSGFGYENFYPGLDIVKTEQDKKDNQKVQANYPRSRVYRATVTYSQPQMDLLTRMTLNRLTKTEAVKMEQAINTQSSFMIEGASVNEKVFQEQGIYIGNVSFTDNEIKTIKKEAKDQSRPARKEIQRVLQNKPNKADIQRLEQLKLPEDSSSAPPEGSNTRVSPKLNAMWKMMQRTGAAVPPRYEGKYSKDTYQTVVYSLSKSMGLDLAYQHFTAQDSKLSMGWLLKDDRLKNLTAEDPAVQYVERVTSNYESDTSKTLQEKIIKEFRDGKINVLFLDPDYTEGITIYDAEQMHIMEPIASYPKLQQVRARVARNGSHPRTYTDSESKEVQVQPQDILVEIFEWRCDLSWFVGHVFNKTAVTEWTRGDGITQNFFQWWNRIAQSSTPDMQAIEIQQAGNSFDQRLENRLRTRRQNEQTFDPGCKIWDPRDQDSNCQLADFDSQQNNASPQLVEQVKAVAALPPETKADGSRSRFLGKWNRLVSLARLQPDLLSKVLKQTIAATTERRVTI